ncbi:MAG: acetylornithine/succinylornithine family transaminase [Phycisphaeraceae bacterium]
MTTPTASPTATQEIIDRHDQYLVGNYGRFPVAIVRGQGVHLYDAEGREYLDLFAGFGGTILGHCHPDLVQAVTEQASKLWHVGNLLHTEPQTLFAQALAKAGFDGQSFFCHCGSDANEAAIKLARLYGKAHPASDGKGYRYKFITTNHSFHGRLFGSMMLTGQDKVRKGYEPLLEGFTHVPYDDLAAVADAADARTIAVMVEPIQGEGGVRVPGDDYLPGLRRLCNERNMLLIVDEVWTGAGRTGRYFAHQHWDIKPDIMTLAKGVGGGLPVGVLAAAPQVAKYFQAKHNHGVVAHGTTLGGNCLSMAVAVAIFNVIHRDNLLDHATKLGEHVKQRVRRAMQGDGRVKEVRGKGLFLGIELDPAAKGASFTNVGQVVQKCLDRGVMVNGTQDTVLRLAPPLTITREQLDLGLDTILDVIRA